MHAMVLDQLETKLVWAVSGHDPARPEVLVAGPRHVSSLELQASQHSRELEEVRSLSLSRS